MNQQRLKAYLNLIEALISCPRGEEWILLRQYEDLVNPELVQVMEQVASQLAREGNIKVAKFLHNWAGKLHHILTTTPPREQEEDKSESYIQLIEALLNCPQGEEGTILAANQELIGPGLVQTMKQVARELTRNGDRQTAEFLDKLAAEVSQKWLQAHAFKPQWGKNHQQPEVSPSPPPAPQAASEAQPSISSTVSTPEMAQHLAAIAQSLAQLNQSMSSKTKATDPLWYMDRLEQASNSNWILTTEEVEQLIGVKPKCTTGANHYQRGCWRFIKVGKVGSQTGWQIRKAEEDKNKTD